MTPVLWLLFAAHCLFFGSVYTPAVIRARSGGVLLPWWTMPLFWVMWSVTGGVCFFAARAICKLW